MVLDGSAFGSCLSHEGGNLMNRISAFTKEMLQSPLAPSTM